VDIVHTSAACGAPAPWVCDYDRDGRRDLLVGAGSDGAVYFYRNTNTDAQPILTTNVLLSAGGLPFSGTLGYRATPYVHDWNGDGRPDLLCGCGDGWVYFFKNTNANTSPGQLPLYAAGEKIKANGIDLNVGVRSAVRVCDWDGDGLKDLVVSAGYLSSPGPGLAGVFWCRNTNSNTNPILQAPLDVLAPRLGMGLTNLITGNRMRLELVDWNNDGITDVILGNQDGTVFYYQGYQFAVTSVNRRSSGELVFRWNSAPFLKYNIMGSVALPGSIDHINSLLASNVPTGGLTTSWTNCGSNCPQFFYRIQAR
jgi:hypothetical protein